MSSSLYQFIPDFEYISDITNAFPAVVTFTTETNFTLYEWISFRVPEANGMIQLNNQKGKILAIDGIDVTIDVDTRAYFPFISATDNQYPCMAVPAGSGVIDGEPTTTLLDAFDNEPLV